MMLKGFAALAILLSLSGVNGLRCRACHRATTINDCTTAVTCGSNEQCYMDEIVTEQLTIQYNAGCRANVMCQSSANTIVGRKRDELISCSRCCTGFDDCNTRLCGIPAPVSNGQCYLCDSDKDGGQGSVSSPSDCATLQTCQDDEMCYLATTVTGTTTTTKHGCYPKRICQFLTQKLLADMDRCYQSHHDPLLCSAAVKKRSDATCHVCCGDSGCNHGTCDQVKDQLYQLWKAGTLDMTTLKKQNGTITG